MKYLKKVGWYPLLFLFLTLLIYWSIAYISLDPDFGYRLQNGKYILSNGILKHDLYSYTMPSFRFVEHSWLSATVLAKLFPFVGRAGLALLFSIVAFVSMLLVHPKKQLEQSGILAPFKLRKSFFGSPVFLLGNAVLFQHIGIRVQVFSWLFVALLMAVVLRKRLWIKYKYFVPLLFLFWGNMHGSLLEGIALLYVAVFVKGFYGRKFPLSDQLIILLSTLATLINPYGIGTWHKAFLVFRNDYIKDKIVEWLPFYYKPNLVASGLFALAFLLFVKYYKKLRIEMPLVIITLYQAMSSIRHIPLWTLVSMSGIIKGLHLFSKEVANIKFGKERLARANIVFWYVSFGIFLISAGYSIYTAFKTSENIFYPKNAIVYLKANLPEGEMFSTYEWGGYLNWKFPEKRVFINGQMPIWSRAEVVGESENAFLEYNNIVSGEVSYRESFDKYGINTVLWNLPVKGGGNKLPDKLERIFSFLKTNISSDYDLISQLREDGWVEKYKDNISIILTSENDKKSKSGFE